MISVTELGHSRGRQLDLETQKHQVLASILHAKVWPKPSAVEMEACLETMCLHLQGGTSFRELEIPQVVLNESTFSRTAGKRLENKTCAITWH